MACLRDTGVRKQRLSEALQGVLALCPNDLPAFFCRSVFLSSSLIVVKYTCYEIYHLNQLYGSVALSIFMLL